MKKYLLLLVAAVCATVVRAADGDTFTYEGLKFRVISEDNHTVTVDRDQIVSGDVSIPSEVVNGSSSYSVAEISMYAFYGCKITSVTMPNSVTEVGERAFCACRSLASVAIPASVTVIGDGAFLICDSMTEIVVENGNQNYSSESGVLFNADKTTLIQYPGGKTGGYTIPNSVVAVGNMAFYGCIGLTSVAIPASVTEIGVDVFSDSGNLTDVVVEAGNPCYSSESGVLFNADKTTLIYYPGGKTGEYSIPDSVSIIGLGAFYNCSGLSSVTIPNSVTTIEIAAFRHCGGLTTVFIPDSVTEMGDMVFFECSSLTSVAIPNSVTEIGSSTFGGCRSLASVTIPESVTEIQMYAFSGCSNLKAIYNLNPMPQPVGEQAFNGVPDDAVVYVPVGSLDDYREASDWRVWFSDFREMGTVVDNILTDTVLIDVFNLQGVTVLRSAAVAELQNLPAGLYIVRQGKNVKKVAVK